jgi:hypothetical protein
MVKVLNVVAFTTPVLMRHLWQLKTAVFLHWCLIHAVLFDENETKNFLIEQCTLDMHKNRASLLYLFPFLLTMRLNKLERLFLVSLSIHV